MAGEEVVSAMAEGRGYPIDKVAEAISQAIINSKIEGIAVTDEVAASALAEVHRMTAGGEVEALARRLANSSPVLEDHSATRDRVFQSNP